MREFRTRETVTCLCHLDKANPEPLPAGQADFGASGTRVATSDSHFDRTNYSPPCQKNPRIGSTGKFQQTTRLFEAAPVLHDTLDVVFSSVEAQTSVIFYIEFNDSEAVGAN